MIALLKHWYANHQRKKKAKALQQSFAVIESYNLIPCKVVTIGGVSYLEDKSGTWYRMPKAIEKQARMER
jgi:hypothetical protein